MRKTRDDGWSDWPAPAKLNLFLQIVGRRPDGYHLLQTVFQLLDWGDSIALRLRNDDEIRCRNPLSGLQPDDDLAVRAARALQASALQASTTALGRPIGVDIVIEKRIPVGGGFGGGSSDAATVLLALNRLWDLQLSVQQLSALGLTLGADVPVFIQGHSAWAEGVGEQLTPIPLPERHYVLLDPGVSVPTAELFQAPELTRNAAPLTMAGLADLQSLGNAFEPVLRARSIKVDAALDAMSAFGCAHLTGSGGGCFIAFEAEREASEAERALSADFRVWRARGVNLSPMHERLSQFES